MTFGSPLAAILSLNTISHTVGAAGAGAQAALGLRETSIAIFSAVPDADDPGPVRDHHPRPSAPCTGRASRRWQPGSCRS